MSDPQLEQLAMELTRVRRATREALDGIVALIRESREWQAGADPLADSIGHVGRLIGELGDCKYDAASRREWLVDKKTEPPFEIGEP